MELLGHSAFNVSRGHHQGLMLSIALAQQHMAEGYFLDNNSVVGNSTAFQPAPVNNTGGVRHLGTSVQVLLSAMYGLGICGNVAALVMLGRQETQRNKRQTLMLKCLTWNDLLAVAGSAVQMYLQLYLPSPWVLNPYFCGVRVFWRVFGLGSGCVAVTMALERWIALTKPFLYQTKVTYHRILRFIFGMWMAVILLTCLPFMGFGHFYDHTQVGWKKCSRSRFGTTPEDVAYAYIWFAFGVVMCVVIVACNLCVIEALYQMSRRSETRRLTHQISLTVGNNTSTASMADFSTGQQLMVLMDGGAVHNGQQQQQHHSSHLVVRQQSEEATANHNAINNGAFNRERVHRSSTSSSASAVRRRQTQEEVKFARLMVILSIFYVICWIPQLVAMPMGLADPKIQEKTFYRAADICMALNFVMDPFIYVLFRGRCHRCCCCSWQTLFMCFASFFRRSKEERKPVFYQESSSRIRPPTTANEFILPSEEDGIEIHERRGDQDRDLYVPLKPVATANGIKDPASKENWV